MCEKKDADQLCGNRTTDQQLCFRYMVSTIPLLLNPKFRASYSLIAQPYLCRTWSETPKTGFLRTRLNLGFYLIDLTDACVKGVKINLTRKTDKGKHDY